MINTLLLALVLPVYTILAAAIGIPHALLTGSNRLLYWLGRLGVRIGFLVARIRIVVHGKEKLPPTPHFIYMMNHASNLDAPAVFLHLPGEVRALGKKELFKIPVLATAMRIAGFVAVDRSRRDAAIASVQRAAELARGGASFLIAPEGTRSRSGRLLPFKKGGFYLSIESQVPILPISVRGAYELMPPGSLAIRSGTIEIVFHDPIPASHLRSEDRDRLMQGVRQRIESGLHPEASAPGAIAGVDDRLEKAASAS